MLRSLLLVGAGADEQQRAEHGGGLLRTAGIPAPPYRARRRSPAAGPGDAAGPVTSER